MSTREEREEKLILQIPEDRDYNDYKVIQVGETYPISVPIKVVDPKSDAVEEEIWLERGAEGEVIDEDADGDWPKKAVMRFMLSEGDENEESVFVDVTVPYEDIDNGETICWTCMSDDEQDDYDLALDYMEEQMTLCWGEGPWNLYVHGYDLDWQHRSGFKTMLGVHHAKKIVESIVPRSTQWYLWMYSYEEPDETGAIVKGFQFSVAHHDVPMGSSIYVIPYSVPKPYLDEASAILLEEYGREYAFDSDEAAEYFEGSYTAREMAEQTADNHDWEVQYSFPPPWEAKEVKEEEIGNTVEGPWYVEDDEGGIVIEGLKEWEARLIVEKRGKDRL